MSLRANEVSEAIPTKIASPPSLGYARDKAADRNDDPPMTDALQSQSNLALQNRFLWYNLPLKYEE